MGGEHRLEHRAAERVPAPAPIVEFEAPEQVESPFPIPGLAVSDPIRRSSTDPLGGSAIDQGTEQALKSPSGGSRLDDSVKSSMESAFNTDFSDVRVHTGSSAAKLSTDLQATAFTHGSNIFFSQGSYDPGSEGGRHLLAHELAHVVQRKQGRDNGAASPAGATTIGRADDPLEAEADSAAGRVVDALRRQTRG
jgi:hypothetical protein